MERSAVWLWWGDLEQILDDFARKEGRLEWESAVGDLERDLSLEFD